MTIVAGGPTLRRHLRYATSAAFAWASPSNMPGRHALRVERLRSSWPELAQLLDGLVESMPDEDDESIAGPTCPACAGGISRVRIAPDPRTAVQVCKVEPCGHEIDREAVGELHWAGVPTDVTPVDGATLIGAEVRAQREAGHTIEADMREHDDGDLAWVAWCLIGESHSRDVPAMWPFSPARWKPGLDRIDALKQAGAYVAAEIDRELAKRAQEAP